MTALGLGLATPVAAQSSVDWSGLAYLDYAYLLASDDAEAVGDNSFDYRRIYLTADARLDDAFRMRVRLEAKGSSTTGSGRPAPFVKDAWLRWDYSEAGHRAVLGVQPPPLFDVTEAVWGYLSLEKTVMDRVDARDSRDFGLRVDGPVAGPLSYGVMVANGNGVRPDPDGAPGKRVYGQLRLAPEGPFRATLGADVTADDALGAEGGTSVRVSALAGAVTEAFHGGVEVFSLRLDPDAVAETTSEGVGVSAFGAVAVSPWLELVARYDYVEADAGDAGADAHYALAAVAYQPSPAVRLMPNLVVTRLDGAAASVLGRFTVHVDF